MAKVKYAYQVRNPVDDSVVVASDYDYDTPDAAKTAGTAAYDAWAAKQNLTPVQVVASDGQPIKDSGPVPPEPEPNNV